jgi:hypothetical protein
VLVPIDPVTGSLHAFYQGAAFPAGKIAIRKEVPPELTYLALVPVKSFGFTGGDLTIGKAVLNTLLLAMLAIFQVGRAGGLRKKQKTGNENGGNDERLLFHDRPSFGLVLTGKTCREAVWSTWNGKKKRSERAGAIEKGGFDRNRPLVRFKEECRTCVHPYRNYKAENKMVNPR